MPLKPSTGAAVVLIPFGALVTWGGLSGFLPAILAAMFARDQLVRVKTSSIDLPPPFITGPPTSDIPTGEIVPPSGLNAGESTTGLGSGESYYAPGYGNIPLEAGTPALGTGSSSIIDEIETELKSLEAGE